MHVAVWSRAVVVGSIGVALVAMLGTLCFEASADSASSPTFGDRAWLAEADDVPLDRYRSWREVIGEPSPSECDHQGTSGSAHYHDDVTTCRGTLGLLRFVDTRFSSGGTHGGGSSRALTLERSSEPCEVSWSRTDFGVPSPYQSSWGGGGDLLYAHDRIRDLHRYRCVISGGRNASVPWTLSIYGPGSRVAARWRASRPLVPYERLGAVALLVLAMAILARQERRNRSSALAWQEATRGTDGVLRLGEVAVQTGVGDDCVTTAAAVCVVVPEEPETGIYRAAATVTPTHARVGSLDALRREHRRDCRVSAIAVVGFAAASLVLSAWLIAVSLRV